MVYVYLKFSPFIRGKNWAVAETWAQCTCIWQQRVRLHPGGQRVGSEGLPLSSQLSWKRDVFGVRRWKIGRWAFTVGKERNTSLRVLFPLGKGSEEPGHVEALPHVMEREGGLCHKPPGQELSSPRASGGGWLTAAVPRLGLPADDRKPKHTQRSPKVTIPRVLWWPHHVFRDSIPFSLLCHPQPFWIPISEPLHVLRWLLWPLSSHTHFRHQKRRRKHGPVVSAPTRSLPRSPFLLH